MIDQRQTTTGQPRAQRPQAERELWGRVALHAFGTDRPALAAHVASLVAGAALILWLDRHMWFSYDEWAFFAIINPAVERGDWIHFLFAPYINHWVTIPNLVWEVVYRIVGMRMYVAYLLPVMAAHLAVVAMVRAVLRRAGVGGWLATALSLVVLLPGPGAGLVTFGWQIEFLGALAFGLAQLLLTDHEGPLDWRDGVGVGCGLLGLMCSSVSLAMIGAVAFHLALRSRWKATVLAVAPLLAAFVTWYVAIGHAGAPSRTAAELALLPRFIWIGVAATLDGLLGVTGVAGVIALGVIWMIARNGLDLRAPGLSLVGAMAGAGVLFFAITGYGRISFGVDYAASSRYLYVGTVLLMPLLGVVVSRFVRVPRLMPVVAGALIWATAANVSSMYLSIHHDTLTAVNLRLAVERLAASPQLDDMDPNQPVNMDGAMYITVGLVRKLRDQGQLP
jgi:hypothetical protein